MQQSLVTVVIPIYNVEKYLERCLNSIVGQTYSNLEILLIDDGSPDKCPQICENWAKKDNRIKVIHKQNEGLGMARNTGIEHATGKYICFFDSDDYIDTSTIKKCVELAEKNRAEVVVFGMVSVNSRGKIVEEAAPEAEKLLYLGTEVQTQFLPCLIDSRNQNVRIRNLCLSACSCLFSLELVRRTNWRFVSERELISEDSYSLIWLYQSVTCVAILPEALYFYCRNEVSLTQTYREDRFLKIRQFYLACQQMARDAEYDQSVLTAIDGLFLSFTISAMKQSCAVSLRVRDRITLLNQITGDSILQSVIKSTDLQEQNRQRKLLFWSIRKKLCWITYYLVSIQNLKERFG